MYAATLRHASLSKADLRETQMQAVYLAHANLRRADLGEADLTVAVVFHQAGLTGANLASAVFCNTIVAACPNLHQAEGLSQVRHLGPSSLDRDTLRGCVHWLPDVFLEGIGYTGQEIQTLRAMYPAPSG